MFTLITGIVEMRYYANAVQEVVCRRGLDTYWLSGRREIGAELRSVLKLGEGKSRNEWQDWQN